MEYKLSNGRVSVWFRVTKGVITDTSPITRNQLGKPLARALQYLDLVYGEKFHATKLVPSDYVYPIPTLKERTK